MPGFIAEAAGLRRQYITDTYKMKSALLRGHFRTSRRLELRSSSSGHFSTRRRHLIY